MYRSAVGQQSVALIRTSASMARILARGSGLCLVWSERNASHCHRFRAARASQSQLSKCPSFIFFFGQLIFQDRYRRPKKVKTCLSLSRLFFCSCSSFVKKKNSWRKDARPFVRLLVLMKNEPLKCFLAHFHFQLMEKNRTKASFFQLTFHPTTSGTKAAGRKCFPIFTFDSCRHFSPGRTQQIQLGDAGTFWRRRFGDNYRQLRSISLSPSSPVNGETKGKTVFHFSFLSVTQMNGIPSSIYTQLVCKSKGTSRIA